MKKQRLLKVVLIVIIIFSLGIGYAIWCNYSDVQIPCIFYKRTGLLCPGCGGTRMCMALLEFNFKEAFYYNKAVFILMPYFIWIICKYTLIYINCGTSEVTKKDNIGIMVAIVVLVIYGVVRNIVPYNYF